MDETFTTTENKDGVQSTAAASADKTEELGCTTEDLYLPSSLRYILLVFGVMLIIENISMIVTIARHRELHTNSNILVASLAISDVLIGLLCLLMSLISEPDGFRSHLGMGPSDLRTFDSFGSGANCGLIFISMAHLAALSVDRFLYLLWPLRYHDTALISPVTRIPSNHIQHDVHGTATETEPYQNHLKKQLRNNVKQDKTKWAFNKAKLKILKFVIMMCGCYLVCVFPSLIVLVFDKLSHIFHFSKPAIVSVTLFLFTNSGVNFLIMLHMNKCFRAAFLNSFPYRYLKVFLRKDKLLSSNAFKPN